MLCKIEVSGFEHGSGASCDRVPMWNKQGHASLSFPLFLLITMNTPAWHFDMNPNSDDFFVNNSTQLPSEIQVFPSWSNRGSTGIDMVRPIDLA